MAQFTETGVELVVKGSRDFFGTLDKAGGRIAGFGKTVGKVAVAGMAAFGAAAAGVAVASVSAAISFESAWAGVIKTTDGLVDEMGNLTAAGEEVQQGFRNLAKEVPTSVEELLAIGELGGQLGIAQDSLIDFTRTIAAMGEATNLTTEEAATGFAQIANIMQTPQGQIENMGSSIVALGNNFATTERDILNFAQRIAGAGEIVGLTEAEVFAIGAAFSSVGVQAEAGGTAVQKVLLGMNQAALEGEEQWGIFAGTASLAVEDFAAAFELSVGDIQSLVETDMGAVSKMFGDLWQQDAGTAFDLFVKGLGESGDDALTVLSALGLEDQRLVRSFLSLANAGDLLTESMDLSSSAFHENTALTKEAEQRYATTESQFKIFKNVIKDVGITIGSALLPPVNDLLQAARPLIDEFAKQLPQFLENNLIPAIQVVTAWLGQNLPVAIAFLGNLWTNVLQPALTMFWQFVTTTLIPLLSQLFTWLSQNIPVAIQFLADLWTGTLQPALQAVWEFIQTSVIPVLQQISDWLGQNIPVAVQALSNIFNSVLKPAIETIVSAFQLAVAWVQENWPQIQSIIQGVIEVIRDVVIPTVVEIVTFFVNEWGKIVAWVQENWPLIQEVISDVLGTIQTIVSTILTAIRNLWIEHGDTIKTFINTLWNLIKSIIEQAMNLVRGAIQAVLFIISGNWEEAWNLIKATAQNIWNALVGFFKQAGPALWDVIRNIVKQIPNIILSIGGKLLEVGGKIVEKLREGISNAWDSLVGWFKSKLDDLTSLLPFSEPKDPTSPLRGLAQAGEAIVKNITAGMAAAVGQLDAMQTNLALAAQQAAVQSATSTTASSNVNVTNNFNTSMNGRMDQSTFESSVLRVVERAVGQFT